MTAAPRSLQGRLLGLVLAVVAGVWVVTAVVTWFDVRHELDELLDAHLAQAAALLVVQQAGELEHDDDRTLDAPSLHKYAPKAVFQVFHEGRLVLRSAEAPREPLVASTGRKAAGFATVRIDGTAWRVFAARGAERDVQVFVGERVDSRSRIVWAVLWGTLWPLALALPLLALLAWWAIRHGLRPLRALHAQLVQRQPASLQPVTLERAPSEVTPLVDTLNGLFERIGALLEGERRFTADAAHELRTPIAAIRAQAQVALRATDDAGRRHALHATLEGCDRATRLVEQLLMLSRLEAEAAPPAQPVDLAAVARQVLADLAPKADARRQDLGLDAPARCEVSGDPVLVAVLLRNLVDNAIRYSPSGARIAVGVQALADRCVMLVEDSGPGLSDEERARLGRRFHRGQGHEASGSGLGWSIVQRIAAVHGWTLDVSRSAALGGLAVRVSCSAWPGGSAST